MQADHSQISASPHVVLLLCSCQWEALTGQLAPFPGPALLSLTPAMPNGEGEHC